MSAVDPRAEFACDRETIGGLRVVYDDGQNVRVEGMAPCPWCGEVRDDPHLRPDAEAQRRAQAVIRGAGGVPDVPRGDGDGMAGPVLRAGDGPERDARQAPRGPSRGGTTGGCDMEHIVQFGINLDDASIAEAVKRDAYKEVVKQLTDEARKALPKKCAYGCHGKGGGRLARHHRRGGREEGLRHHLRQVGRDRGDGRRARLRLNHPPQAVPRGVQEDGHRLRRAWRRWR